MEQKRSGRRPVTAALATLVAAAVGVTACSGGGGGGTVTVPAFEAELGDLTQAISGIGYVEAAASYRVRSAVTGELLDVRVVSGQQVQAGDIIAVIDSPMVDSQVVQAELLVAQMEAQAAGVEAQFVEADALLEQQRLTSVFLDSLELSLEEFDAALETEDEAPGADTPPDESTGASTTPTASSDSSDAATSIIVADASTARSSGSPAIGDPDIQMAPVEPPGAAPAAPTLPDPDLSGFDLPDGSRLGDRDRPTPVEDRADAFIAKFSKAIEDALSAALKPLLNEIGELESTVEDAAESIVDEVQTGFEALDQQLIESTELLNDELDELQVELQDIEATIEDLITEIEDTTDEAQQRQEIVIDEYQEYTDDLTALSESTADDLRRSLSGPTQALVTVARKQLDLARTAQESLIVTAPAAGTVVLGSEPPASSASLGAGAGAGSLAGAGGLLASSSSSTPAPQLQIGSAVTAGQVVLEIHQTDALQAVTEVDEFQVVGLELGQNAAVSIEALDTDLIGHISYISPVGTRSANGATYRVTVLIASGQPLASKVRPGMSVGVDVIEAEIDSAILIRDIAIDHVGELPTVFVLEDGRVRSVPITILGTDGVLTAVTGIQAGQQVVIATRDIQDGDSVQAARS